VLLLLLLCDPDRFLSKSQVCADVPGLFCPHECNIEGAATHGDQVTAHRGDSEGGV
jgi:hypothetical protein